MNINLRIERLVVDRDAIATSDGRRFSAALRIELMRLLAERSIPITDGAALPMLRAAPVGVEAGTEEQAVGRDVARSIYGSFAAR